ncbi:MAG TPA: YafY family protein [Clostridiales bacterium]|nr:YafY family protein [Clostridiales bacterium]HPV01241.1 YafY family protein [Clostridiales bacterium]
MNRLFEIVYILLGKERVTAKELAERFEVSRRTIYRDIEALSAAGIPVYTERGRDGGIGLLPGFTLNRSLLSEQEQEDVISALQALEAVNPRKMAQALTKLSAVFNRKLVNWIEVDFSSWSRLDDGLFDRLKAAIFEKVTVEFDYYSTKGEKTHRRVEPVQLFFKHQAWYLKGFCLSRKSMRMFKLTRIKNLQLTDQRFDDRHSPETMLQDTADGENARPVMLKLKIGPEMAYRVYDEFEPRNIQKQPDGSFVVSAAFTEDEWLYGYILSFCEYAEVIEPPHIRETIREKLERTYGKYI